MQVKNKESGEIEGLPYDEAMAAVKAGTHFLVNVDADGKPKPVKEKQSKPAAAAPKA